MFACCFVASTSWGVDMTRDYVKALECRELPHLLVGSKSFHHREEVETLRTALTRLSGPKMSSRYSPPCADRYSPSPIRCCCVFATSWSPPSLRKYPDDPELKEITDALKLVADLHRTRNWRPTADTVNALLEAVRAHAAFAMRPTGHQALANIYRICDLARSFELSGGISFRGFVEELMGPSGESRRARSFWCWKKPPTESAS